MIHGALGQLWAFTTFLSLLVAIALGIYLWKISSEEREEEINFYEKGKREEVSPIFKEEATSKVPQKTKGISAITFSMKRKFATEDFLLKIVESGNVDECIKILKQVFVSPETFEKYKNIFPENFLNTFKPNEEMAELWAKQSSLSPSSSMVILEAKRRLARFQPAILLSEDKKVLDFAKSKGIPAYQFEDIF
jgi:hypothetical protein